MDTTHLTLFSTYLESMSASPAIIDEALLHAQLVAFPTRHILTHQGQKPEHVYFLIEGLCHACYLHENGTQHTKELYWEPNRFLGLEPLFMQSPSPFLLETLSASQLIMLPMTLLASWQAQCVPLYQQLLENQMVLHENKARFMAMYTPQDRYQLLRQYLPATESMLTDAHIASYLNIAIDDIAHYSNASLTDSSSH